MIRCRPPYSLLGGVTLAIKRGAYPLAFSRLIVVAAMWAGAGPCHAARVYQVVNYPLEQFGHTINGTITTTDDAPLDSILQATEILDWQWSITGPHAFSAMRNEFVD